MRRQNAEWQSADLHKARARDATAVQICFLVEHKCNTSAQHNCANMLFEEHKCNTYMGNTTTVQMYYLQNTNVTDARDITL